MNTIFVSIASYRDENCPKTLLSLYENARHPERIFVGICEQNKDGDIPCIPKNFPYLKNIRILQKKYTDAKGPTWARYLCSTLYKDEDFFLQVDSHSLFVNDWDMKCIEMIESLEKSSEIENKKVMLSHYPPSYHNYEKNPSNDKITTMVECFFNNDGILSFKGAQWRTPGPLPRRNAFIAGGFIFCRGNWVKEVPFDPHLKYLFVGEEILITVRSYTSGWDVYTPNKNIVYHFYTRPKDPKIWKDLLYSNNEVKQKVKIICKLDNDLSKLTTKEIYNSLEKYNIGKERTIEDFYDFIGVDIKTKKIGKPKVEFFIEKNDNSLGNQIILALFFLFLLFLIIKKYN